MFLQLLLCPLEAELVLLVQPLALRQLLQHHCPLLVPHRVESAVCDVGTTGRDHLVGHLHKESRHLLGGVVIARVAVDHADGVDESWNGIQHLHLQT